MNIIFLTDCTPRVIIQAFIWTFMALAINAQPVIEWDKNYGGNIWEELNSVMVTDDDGYFMTGFTSSSADGDVTQSNYGIGDFWVVKANSTGDVVWDKRYGGDSLDRIWKSLYFPGEGYLLAGESRSPVSGMKTAPAYGQKDFWVVRIDLDGNYIWDKSYGGTGEDWLLAAAPAPNGGCLLGGWSDSAPNIPGSKSAPHKGDVDIWLLMIDAQGNPLWDRSYGGIQMEQIHDIQLLSDGNYVVAGSSASGICPDKSQPNWGSVDYWIIKINPQGDIIWEKTFGGTDEDVAIVIREGSNGELYVGGGSKSPVSGTKISTNLGDADYWLIKLDANGQELFQKRFGGETLDKIYAINLTKNGYFIIGGISGSDINIEGSKMDASHGDWDMWILYLDPLGEYVWDKVVGGASQDALTDIVRVKDGSFALVGNSASDSSFEHTANSKGFNDFWLVKTFCDSPIEIRGDSTGCQYEELTLNINIDDCAFCKYTWSDGSHGSAITFTPDQDLNLTAYVLDSRGCESADSFFVTIFQKPYAAEFELMPPVCHGYGDGKIQLLDIKGGTPPYQYSFEGAPFSSETLLQHLDGGTYEMEVTDLYGCNYDTIVSLEEPAPFFIELGQDTIINLGDSIRMMPVANFPVAEYIWDHPEFEDLTPWLSPEVPTSYFITAWNGNGCEASDNRTIYIRIPKDYFAPNVFSPNGDGTNEVFTIYAGKNTVAIRNLTIYDRWGTQVYFKDVVFPGSEISGGWDGTFKGQLMDNDVYIYHAQIEFIDGTVELEKGDVTLVR